MADDSVSDWDGDEGAASADDNSSSEDNDLDDGDDDDAQEEDGSLSTIPVANNDCTATKKIVKMKNDATRTQGMRTRLLKHKTMAAAGPNPSNFLKRSHKVFILDAAADDDTNDNKNNTDGDDAADDVQGAAADDDDNDNDETTRAAKRQRRRQPTTKKLRRVNFETEDDGLDHVPSFERVTNRGGYAHTKNSRMKISAANKGKMPWNKGKSRSDTAKSKISAGVRARNHAILMEKLKKLGMSEEAWFEKKSQIKHFREKVRKARLVVKQHEQSMEAARKMQEEEEFKEAMMRAIKKEEYAALQSTEQQRPSNYLTMNAPIARSSTSMHQNGQTNPQVDKEEQIQPKDAGIHLEAEDESNNKAINDTILSTGNPPVKHPPLSDPPATGTDHPPSSSGVIKVGRFKDIAKAQTNTFEFPDSIPLAPTVILVDPEPVTVMVGKAKKTFHTTNIFLDDENPEAPATTEENAISLSTQEISWEPHDLCNPAASYKDKCPVGGPGGLICCTSCTSRYSQFLSITFRDLERHQITSLGEEVEEVMDYSRETKKRLAESTKAAKRKHVGLQI